MIVKNRKLQLYGYISHSLGGAKTIELCTVKGRGVGETRRTKEEVEDNIREWTDLEEVSESGSVENGVKRRTLVVKSSVAPQ